MPVANHQSPMANVLRFRKVPDTDRLGDEYVLSSSNAQKRCWKGFLQGLERVKEDWYHPKEEWEYGFPVMMNDE